jgi:hypothetical protein
MYRMSKTAGPGTILQHLQLLTKYYIEQILYVYNSTTAASDEYDTYTVDETNRYNI